MVQLAEGGAGSTLPAGSMARTLNVWPAAARPDSPSGDEHAVKGAPSSEHSNVQPASLAVNEMAASRAEVIAGGAEVIEVEGGVTSTTHATSAGVGSTWP